MSEEELLWRKEQLDERDRQLNAHEEQLVEKERSLKQAAERIFKGLEYLEAQVKQMVEKGNVENPRGGVRHVIPGKGYYGKDTVS